MNSINTAVPSQEHAVRRRPHGDQLASNTECVNNSCITTRGLFNDVNHTDKERSRDPIATQQYCCGLEEPGCFFWRILPLNLYKEKKRGCKYVYLIYKYLNITFDIEVYSQSKKQNKIFLIHTTQVTAFLCPTKSLSCVQPSLSIICAVGPPPFIAWADTKY